MKTRNIMKIAGVLLTLIMIVSLMGVFALTANADETPPLAYDGTPVTPTKIDSSNYAKFGFTSSNWSAYDGYYAITNAKELYGFAEIVNKSDKSGTGACAILVNDIVVNTGTVTSLGSSDGTTYSWTPIAKNYNNDYNYYKGTFDGRGYTISGLYAGDATAKPVGLFGALGQKSSQATVKNLIVANSYFAGESCVGAIAGHVQGATIANCKVASDVTVFCNVSAGGIAGMVAYSCTIDITSCVNLGKVVGAETNARNVGAILGNTMENSSFYVKISDCYYITGNTTANGENQAGVGSNMSSKDNGTTGIAAASASHTCVGIEHSEISATCKNGGIKGYTECMICGTVMSGEKGEIPIGNHAYNSNGECMVCGAQVAASLTTADAPPVVTYYKTLEEAITAAQSADGSTITLLDDCSPATGYWFTVPGGSFTIDLNGKQLTVVNSVYAAIAVESGNIILKDSVGQGGSNGGAFVRNSGTLTVTGGTFGGSVKTTSGTLNVEGGNFAIVSLDYDENPGTLAVKGGNIAKLQVKAQQNGKKLSDVLPKDYYLVDANGSLVDTANAQLSNTYYYYAENVTVQHGAVITEDMIVVHPATYNGTVQTPTVSVKVGGVQLTYDVDYTVAVVGGTETRNVGKYSITINGIGNYTGSVEKTFTIEKATPQASDFTFTPPVDRTYNGEEKSATVTAKGGIVGVGEITVTYYKDGNETASPTNAGTYTVMISVAEGDNYNAVTGLEIDSFTVEKATPVLTAPTAIEGLIYNGAAKALVMAGSTTGGTLMYGVFNGIYNGTGPIPAVDYSEELPTATNSGNYTVFVRVIGNENYNAVDDYSGYVAVTVAQATPTLNVTSPVPSVLPGNTILLSYTLTGVKGEELTNTVGIINAKVGDLVCDIDGLKVTVPSAAVIGGEDKLVVTLRSLADGNYTDSEVFTLTLDVGIADFSGAIADLEADIDELNKLIAEGGDIDEINEKLTEITNRVKALEDNGATDAELEAAKTELTTAYTKAIEDAVADLEAKIEAQIDPTELAAAIKDVTDIIDTLDNTYATDTAVAEAIEKAESELATAVSALEDKLAEEIEKLQNQITSNDTDIEGINTSITTINGLIDALEAADVTLDGKITDAVNAAKSDLATAVSTLEDKIAKEVEKLQNQITSNDTDIEGINTSITTINGLIDALKKADEALDGDISDAITKAENELKAAQDELKDLIGDVQTNLDNAKEELDQAIADLEAAMKQGDADLSTEIANLNTALTNAKAALEKADADNKAELEGKITEAQTTLQSAIDKVAKDLADAEKELEDAIASGDAALGNRISSVSASLIAAKTALEKADADNKAELIAKIEAAEATLDAAIKAVQKNLDDAKAELNKAIADGDTALDGKIAALNDALASAKSALEATDAANKSELTAKIDEADAALQAAINALSNELNNVKNELGNTKSELESKDSELKTFIIIVCVISCVTFCGCGTLAVFYFIDKKKKI